MFEPPSEAAAEGRRSHHGAGTEASRWSVGRSHITGRGTPRLRVSFSRVTGVFRQLRSLRIHQIVVEVHSLCIGIQQIELQKTKIFTTEEQPGTKMAALATAN